MPRHEYTYETPKWRTLWLILGFAALIGIGIATVLLPELEDEPAEGAESTDIADEDQEAPSE